MDRRPTHRVGENSAARIIVADDHPLFREALGRILNGYSDLKVVGEAEDGQRAVELCRRLCPELVLMDVQMPVMNGLEATRAIKQEFPQVAVLMLTAFEDTKYLAEAILEGAAGYVLKHAKSERIVEAIREALSGESPIDRELSGRLLSDLLRERKQQGGPVRELAPERSGSRGERQEEESLVSRSLTPRETEVLKLLAQGRTNYQIARSLGVSLSTVKKHVRYIITKLGVSDRTQAALKAVELGLLPSSRNQDGSEY